MKKRLVAPKTKIQNNNSYNCHHFLTIISNLNKFFIKDSISERAGLEENNIFHQLLLIQPI